MNTFNPIDLLFSGMGKLGDDVHTLNVLKLLPRRHFGLIVDAGCGTGRQTIALATELNTLVHAIDVHEPFLADLIRRAKTARIEHLVQVHCMDMKDIPDVFQRIDLLWSEGAAYNMGFSNALATWAPAINPEGFAVVSEMSWVREQIPDKVRSSFYQVILACSQFSKTLWLLKKQATQYLQPTHCPEKHGLKASTIFSENGQKFLSVILILP